MTPLSNKQKASLAQLARRAWQHVGSAAADPLPDLDTWRRSEVFAACGKHGLSECTQREFNLVAAHFHSILGEDGIAMNELLRAGTERRRQMEMVLLRELESAHLPLSYAESISRSRFGVTVTETSDVQFQQLLITVKARARAKRRKQMEAAA